MFGVAPGMLTDNGAKLETMLGGSYQLWLTKEGLLTGKDPADAAFVYFRANGLERTIATAQSFAAGMLPAGGVNVNYYSAPDSDPLFDPVGAGVAQLDQRKAIAAVMGRMRASLMKLKRTWWKTGAAFNWVLVPKKMVAPKTL